MASTVTVTAEGRRVLRLRPDLSSLAAGLPTELPPMPPRDDSVPHAPKRPCDLTAEEFKLALQNALRYFPKEMHADLAPEFAQELREHGHIYMYRFRYSVHGTFERYVQLLLLSKSSFLLSFFSFCFIPLFNSERNINFQTHGVRDEGLPYRRIPRQMQASSSCHTHDNEQLGSSRCSGKRFRCHSELELTRRPAVPSRTRYVRW